MEAPADVHCDVMSTSSTADEEAVIKATESLSIEENASCVRHPAVSLLRSSSDPSPGDNSSSSSSSSSSAAAKTSTKTATSVDDDSAYMTQPASVSSTPSSVSPVSWGHDWNDRRDDADTNTVRQKLLTESLISSSSSSSSSSSCCSQVEVK